MITKTVRWSVVVFSFLCAASADLRAMKDKESFTSGIPSLPNCGNTCYANALIQVSLNSKLTQALNPADYTQLPAQLFAQLLNELSNQKSYLATLQNFATSIGPALSQGRAGDVVSKFQNAFGDMLQKGSFKDLFSTEEQVFLVTSGLNAVKSAIDKQEQQIFVTWTKTLREKLDKLKNKPAAKAINDAVQRLQKIVFEAVQPQEDPSELLNLLFRELIQNDTIAKFVAIDLRQLLYCSSNNAQSLTDQGKLPYLDLAITKDVQGSLNEFFSAEKITINNPLTRVEDTTCTKRFLSDSAPNVLMLTLKRFKQDAKGAFVKNTQSIAINPTIQLKKEFTVNNVAANYQISGIVVHKGATLSSGHYIAYVKKDTQWYSCDDSAIKKVTEKTMLDDASKGCYILVYEKLPEETPITPVSLEKPIEEKPVKKPEDGLPGRLDNLTASLTRLAQNLTPSPSSTLEEKEHD